MSRQRSASVLVMGILSLVFGGLDIIIICAGCAARGPALLSAMMRQMNTVGARVPAAEYVQLELDRQLPWLWSVEVANAVFLLALSVLLVIAGIGLLRLWYWARYLCVAYGFLIIVLQTAYAVLKLVVVFPVARAAFVQAVLPGDEAGFTRDLYGALIFQVAWFGIFAVVLMIMALRPTWAAAFSGEDDLSVPSDSSIQQWR